MTERAPDGPSASLPPVRGAPLLVVATLPPQVFAWADGLRQAYYPPGRNRLGAHVTLFHGLPPSAEGEVHRLLAATAAAHPAPEARITGLMDLGRGTALAVESPSLSAIHAGMAERLAGLVQQKDARPLRLHITVQNKVPPAEARALQAALSRAAWPAPFRMPGLASHRWNGEAWVFEREWRFRG